MGDRKDFTVPGGGDFERVHVGGIEISTTGAAENYHLVFEESSNSFKPTPPDTVELVNDATKEPMGHENKDDSQIGISVSGSDLVFSISPTSTSHFVWVSGERFEKTTTETVTLSGDGLHYIYYDEAGTLSSKSTYFTWDAEAPTAYVYKNGTSHMLFDERHGITLDWATHEYLHRTRGAVIASGFGIQYTIASVSTTGQSDSETEIAVAEGVFFDEDLEVRVTHSATPTSGTWEQILEPTAQIPIVYKSGSGWVKDASNGHIVKEGTVTARYNPISGGSGSLSDLSNSKFGISWLIATNMADSPIICILGQEEYLTVGEAEEADWSELDLDEFPVVEFRPLFKLIYDVGTGYTNFGKASLRSVQDIRRVESAGISVPASPVGDHGSLVGLGDDDHTQYLLADGTRTAASLSITGNITVGGTVDGRDIAADGSKLDGIEAGATADQTATEILTAVKTVDGDGSGLDADLLDGKHASEFETAGTTATHASNDDIHVVAGTVDGQVATWDNTAGAWTAVTPTPGITEHSDLTGLGDDDHTQYLLADGTLRASSALKVDGNIETTAGSVVINDVSVSRAASDQIRFNVTNSGDSTTDYVYVVADTAGEIKIVGQPADIEIANATTGSERIRLDAAGTGSVSIYTGGTSRGDFTSSGLGVTGIIRAGVAADSDRYGGTVVACTPERVADIAAQSSGVSRTVVTLSSSVGGITLPAPDGNGYGAKALMISLTAVSPTGSGYAACYAYSLGTAHVPPISPVSLVVGQNNNGFQLVQLEWSGTAYRFRTYRTDPTRLLLDATGIVFY